MARIDSGLGWSCDSEYFVSDADTFLGQVRISNSWRKTYKRNDGPAICVNSIGPITYGSNCISTVRDYCIAYSEDYSGVVTRTIDGIIWYISSGGTLAYYAETESPFPDFMGKVEDAIRAAGVVVGGGIQSVPVLFGNLQASFNITVRETQS